MVIVITFGVAFSYHKLVGSAIELSKNYKINSNIKYTKGEDLFIDLSKENNMTLNYSLVNSESKSIFTLKNNSNYTINRKAYDFYLNITNNDVKSEDGLLILTVNNNDTYLKEIEGLTFNKKYNGFELNNQIGIFPLALDKIIEVEDKNTVDDSWDVIVRFYSLKYNTKKIDGLFEGTFIYKESEKVIEKENVKTVLGDIEVLNNKPNFALPANGFYVCTIYDDEAYNPVFSHEPSVGGISTNGYESRCKNIFKLKDNTIDSPDYYTTGDKDSFIKDNKNTYTYLGDGEWKKEYTGIYKTLDDYGISYYYRGSINNNWVYFNNAYWRIVRINGNGSIKLIYAGEDKPTENDNISVEERNQFATLKEKYDDIEFKKENKYDVLPFNTSFDKAEYVGYMYKENDLHGVENESNVKKYLDAWYNENFKDSDNEKYLEDFIICNDRIVNNRSLFGKNYNGMGIGVGHTTFNAVKRLFGNDNKKSSLNGKGIMPTLKCLSKYDAFNVTESNETNGALTNKIGLLTADEVNMAGLARTDNGLNNWNYLYSHTKSLTATPGLFNENGAHVISFGGATGINTLEVTNVKEYLAVRPVISLKANISFTGDGSWNNPYVVK